MLLPRALLLLVLALPMIAAPARAQEVPWSPGLLLPGTRVRVYAPEIALRSAVGEVGWVAADTLFLERRGTVSAAIPVGAIHRIDRSKGDPSNRGLVWGGVLGAAVGALALGAEEAIVGSDCDYCLHGPSAVALHAVVGGTLGFFAGMVLGSAIGVDQWVRVEPPYHILSRPGSPGASARE